MMTITRSPDWSRRAARCLRLLERTLLVYLVLMAVLLDVLPDLQDR